MVYTARPGRVITFYSYKGGTGRSLALANVAWILAAAGRRVLMMDWDLEAPGLHRYFKPFLIDHELCSSDGLMDLIDNYANEAIRPVDPERPLAADWWKPLAKIEDYVLSVDFAGFPPGGRIDLLPAGRQSEAYAIKVSAFNWQNFYDRLGGGGFLEEVRREARYSYDYVLIDSRTGVSDTAGISTAQMPDSLVVCFTYNNQSIKGAAAVARSARNTQAGLSQDRARLVQTRSDGHLEDTPAPFRVFPIPMRVHDGERERLESRRSFAREVFDDLLDPIAVPSASRYWSEVEVPHKLHYAYEEVLAPLMEDAQDPKTVLSSLVRITRYLSGGEVQEYNLPLEPSRRHAFLESFARTMETGVASTYTAVSAAESEEQALVRMAATAMLQFDEAGRDQARSVLCRLVRVGRTEEGGRNYPVRVNLEDIPEAQRQVVTALSQGRLLAISTEVRLSSAKGSTLPEQVVELADERLIVQWPQLARWLEADRDFLLWRQRLQNYRLDWARTAEASALLSGALLAEARSWAHARPVDLNDAEHQFIDASVQAAATATPAYVDPIRPQVTPPPSVPDATAAPAFAAAESSSRRIIAASPMIATLATLATLAALAALAAAIAVVAFRAYAPQPSTDPLASIKPSASASSPAPSASVVTAAPGPLHGMEFQVFSCPGLDPASDALARRVIQVLISLDAKLGLAKNPLTIDQDAWQSYFKPLSVGLQVRLRQDLPRQVEASRVLLADPAFRALGKWQLVPVARGGEGAIRLLVCQAPKSASASPTKGEPKRTVEKQLPLVAN